MDGKYSFFNTLFIVMAELEATKAVRELVSSLEKNLSDVCLIVFLGVDLEKIFWGKSER